MSSLLPSLRLLRWTLAVVAVVAAAIFGNLWGAFIERSKVASELTKYRDTLANIDETHQTEMTKLRTQRDVADASNRELQKSLKQLQEESLQHRAEKRLYDRIEGLDNSSGLLVDSVKVAKDTKGNVYELEITLIQARGKKRVEGQIGVALLGEKDGTNWREIIVDVESDSAPRFDLRFYQTLVVTVPEREFPINKLEINVEPTGTQHKPFNYEKLWAELVED